MSCHKSRPNSCKSRLKGQKSRSTATNRGRTACCKWRPQRWSLDLWQRGLDSYEILVQEKTEQTSFKISLFCCCYLYQSEPRVAAVRYRFVTSRSRFAAAWSWLAASKKTIKKKFFLFFFLVRACFLQRVLFFLFSYFLFFFYRFPALLLSVRNPLVLCNLIYILFGNTGQCDSIKLKSHPTL